MSFAFKNSQDLYASDYIERKKALNNYRYFKKRLDDPKNKANPPKTISNYDGTAYFMRDDVSGTSNSDTSYYLANARSYDHLLSITKGAYVVPTSGRTNKMDSSCVLCPDTSNNLAGELYEGNYNIIEPLIKSPLIIEDCNTSIYEQHIKSETVTFNDASNIENKYDYLTFKYPSRLHK
tara:strand:- start:13165 stop:13701 length:537 start_codon:yes stop_codon:yes gene_type:complete